MLTWGIIFFSTESWNNGGGGKSTAKKRNGDVVDLISEIVGQYKSPYFSRGTHRDQCQIGVFLFRVLLNAQEPVVSPFVPHLERWRRSHLSHVRLVR